MVKKKDDTINNFGEAFAKYSQTAVDSDMDDFYKYFVKNYPGLISTAAKDKRKRMRELGLIDNQDKPLINVKGNKKQQSMPKVQKPKEAVKPVQKTEALIQQTELANTIGDIDLSKFANRKRKRSRKNRLGVSTVRGIPSGLLNTVRYELGPEFDGLTNAETITLFMLVNMVNFDKLGPEVKKVVEDNYDGIWPLALKMRQNKRNQQKSLMQQMKHKVDQNYHMDHQLLLLLAYFVSLSRWGFDSDNVSSVQDIGNLAFDTPSVEKLLETIKATSDENLRVEQQRKGSNMAK